ARALARRGGALGFELFAAEQVGTLGGRLGQGHGGLVVRGGFGRKGPRRRDLPAGGEGAPASAALLDRLDGLEHFLDVAGDGEAAPFGAQDAAAVDQERAALDALNLL